MRIVTWNVNGLRAAIRKGIQKHLDTIQPDVLLLQEVRARPDQLPQEFQQMDGWHVVWNPAQRPHCTTQVTMLEAFCGHGRERFGEDHRS